MSRLFLIFPEIDFVLSGLTLCDGYAASGGGIYNAGGRLLLSGCHVTGNGATFGGGIAAVGPTKTEPRGLVIVTNSTISGNRAVKGGGLAIGNGGECQLQNTTVSGNLATGAGTQGGGGGGILFETNKASLILNCTITGNEASPMGPGGGGIFIEDFVSPPVSFGNTIVGGNVAPSFPDVLFRSSPVLSLGYNLLGDTTGSTGWGATDLLNIAPVLGPL